MILDEAFLCLGPIRNCLDKCVGGDILAGTHFV